MRKEIIRASGKIRCVECPNGKERDCKAIEICTFAFYKGYESGECATKKKLINKHNIANRRTSKK
ncbi:MAG: hypothetical protein IJ150_14310 [Bacteroidales bacterium]|nr:hypothetical protein [Bacteroidales bacterium]